MSERPAAPVPPQNTEEKGPEKQQEQEPEKQDLLEVGEDDDADDAVADDNDEDDDYEEADEDAEVRCHPGALLCLRCVCLDVSPILGRQTVCW